MHIKDLVFLVAGKGGNFNSITYISVNSGYLLYLMGQTGKIKNVD